MRTQGPPAALTAAVRETVLAEDGSVALTVQPLASTLSFAFLPSRIGAWLTALLGLVGLTLCAVGLHGVVAYAASRRRTEIIRLTLGASRRAILRLVLADTAFVSGLGIAAGLVLAFVTTPLLSTFLIHGLRPMDPVSLAATGVPVAAVSLAASWGPARRALRVDPSAVLRSQ